MQPRLTTDFRNLKGYPQTKTFAVTLFHSDASSPDPRSARQCHHNMADEEVVDLTGEIEMAAPITTSSQFTLAKEWINKQRSSMKPWREFVSTSKFSKPKSVAEVGRRVVKNLQEYQSNYILIALMITVYCV